MAAGGVARFLLSLTMGASAGYLAGGLLPWGPGGGARRAALEAELDTLRRAHAQLESLSQVDARAQAELQGALRRSEAERGELARRLAIYGRVLQPERARAALAVEDLAIYDTPVSGALRYRLVLAQGFRRSGEARGRVRVALRTRTGGAWQELPVADVEYRFRYLHVIQGTLRLPGGVQPQEVRVTLEPLERGGRIEQTYAWRAVRIPDALEADDVG